MKTSVMVLFALFQHFEEILTPQSNDNIIVIMISLLFHLVHKSTYGEHIT